MEIQSTKVSHLETTSQHEIRKQGQFLSKQRSDGKVFVATNENSIDKQLKLDDLLRRLNEVYNYKFDIKLINSPGHLKNVPVNHNH